MEVEEPVTWNEIIVFKSWALSKVTHLALVKIIPPSIIEQQNITQKNFIWNGLNPKTLKATINNNYESGGLKKVNIAAKISSLQISSIKGLLDGNFQYCEKISYFILIYK